MKIDDRCLTISSKLGISELEIVNGKMCHVTSCTCELKEKYISLVTNVTPTCPLRYRWGVNLEKVFACRLDVNHLHEHVDGKGDWCIETQFIFDESDIRHKCSVCNTEWHGEPFATACPNRMAHYTKKNCEYCGLALDNSPHYESVCRNELMRELRTLREFELEEKGRLRDACLQNVFLRQVIEELALMADYVANGSNAPDAREITRRARKALE